MVQKQHWQRYRTSRFPLLFYLQVRTSLCERVAARRYMCSVSRISAFGNYTRADVNGTNSFEETTTGIRRKCHSCDEYDLMHACASGVKRRRKERREREKEDGPRASKVRIHERARLVTQSRSYSGEVSERAYLRIYLCAGHGACQTDEGAAATRRLKPRHTRADPSFHRSIVFSPWYLIAVPTPHFPGSLIARW